MVFRILALIFVVSFSVDARAQANAPAAEALFRAGREAAQRGDAQAACDKFRESYRLEAAVGTLLNIAICEATLGELASAWQHNQEVIHALAPTDERMAVARQHLAQLEPRLPRLTIRRAPAAPADMHISLGEIDLGQASFDEALPLDAGTYVLHVHAEGRLDRNYSVVLREGDRNVIEVEPGPVREARASARSSEPPLAAAAPTTTETTRAREEDSVNGTQHMVGLALLGVAGAGLVAGGITTVLWVDRAAVVDDHCGSNMTCDDEGLAATETGQTFFVTSFVAFGIAAVTGGIGAYLLLSDRDPSSERAVSWTPVVSPARVGLTLDARF